MSHETFDHAVIVEITCRYAVPINAFSKEDAWGTVHCMIAETVERIGTATDVRMTLHEIYDGSPVPEEF